MSSPKKVIVVTGGNHGVGLACCLALAAQENMHVILVGYNTERVNAAVKQVQQESAKSSIVEGAIADIGSLASVRRFCESLLARDLDLFCLVCNAGVTTNTKELTEDGFERTIGVNYIGHFLMIDLLRDHVKRIITLSSETHDPEQHTPTSPPNVSNIDQLAIGYESFNGVEAYTTSKLLTTIIAIEFHRRYPEGPEILSFSPGFAPDTGLGRNETFVIPDNFIALREKRGITVRKSADSGKNLAQIASVDLWQDRGWKSGDFINFDRVVPSSSQANDPVLAAEVWTKSEHWITEGKP